jgi:NAD(P)-dependent dehydrogenase (short-subunit alcohol dehydrogenase family)
VATARRLDSLDDVPCELRLALDVTDERSVGRAVGEAGRVDVLVNNAGVGVGGPTEAVPIDEAVRAFDTNFFGAARLIRAVLPAMRARRGGTIVNLSSLSSRVPWPFGGYYAASKAALESLSEALDVEVSPFGVRVLLVEPGVVDTDFGDGFRGFDTDPSHYASLQAAWGRQFEGPHTGADTVAIAVADALERDDHRLRIEIGDDAIRVLAMRRQLRDSEFDGEHRRFYGLPGRAREHVG